MIVEMRFHYNWPDTKSVQEPLSVNLVQILEVTRQLCDDKMWAYTISNMIKPLIWNVGRYVQFSPPHDVLMLWKG